MKKITALLLVFALLTLTGCAGGRSYSFTKENFPKIGGSASLEGFARAIATAASESDIDGADELVDFSRSTKDAYRALCEEKLDLLIAYEPDSETLGEIKKSGNEIEMTEIAKDALIMICSSENEVDGLTQRQVKEIYSGKIKLWSEADGEETAVFPYQSEKARELFDRALNTSGKLNAETKDAVISSENELFSAVTDYKNSKNAIGYATYSQTKNLINGLSSSLTVKALCIDGISPNAETVKKGDYPLTSGVYAVIRKDAPSDSAERILYNWLCGEQGKEVADRYWY